MTAGCSRAPASCGRWRARRSALDDFARSHWREATEAQFAALWQAECAKVPEFADSEFHIITGLLLPIWDRLPSRNMRVYRFETDEGERVIGRLVAPEELGRLYQSLGAEAPALSLRKPGAPCSTAAPCSISPAGCSCGAR